MKKIIDVSQWQGNVKWSVVKGQVDGVILRCGYGSNEWNQDDKEYDYNMHECIRLKIPVEVYIYSYADSVAKAKSEAEHVLRLVKGTKVRRIWYDLEENKLGWFAKDALRAFSEVVSAAGYEVGLYTYESYYKAYLKGVTAYPIWIARYSTAAPNIGVKYIGWQYTNAAKVDGIHNGVDCSHWYGDFAADEPVKKKYQPHVYRFYKDNRHFYTTDTAEYDALVRDGWNAEGTGWDAPKQGHPVYRYIRNGEHIWTMDEKEREALVKAGWKKEGIAFRSSVKETTPIYRLYNDKTGDRVYTKSKNEKKALIKAGWADEGVAFYGRK